MLKFFAYFKLSHSRSNAVYTMSSRGQTKSWCIVTVVTAVAATVVVVIVVVVTVVVVVVTAAVVAVAVDLVCGCGKG